VSGKHPPRTARRLIAVCRADPAGRYDWMGPPRPGDAIVTLDEIAHADLAARRPLAFDELQSWEDRSAGEHRVAELLAAISEHPAVAAIKWHGHPLIDFAEHRLRTEIVRLLRGWTLARAATGTTELICDPAAPSALVMGARAGLGLDPAATPYATLPALPGSRHRRALVRPLMRALAAGSRPERVRVAAVVTGKLALALASLPADELHEAGVGAMPFPGLDHGNGALLALRRRLPLLATYGSPRAGPGPAVRMPERLDLGDVAELDRALTLLVDRLLAGVASEFAQAIGALAGLQRASSLQALLLPNGGHGACRLLIGWARERGLRVGVMQHGIYSLREVEAGERMGDVLFGWGDGTIEQALCWPDPRPLVLPVGLPGAADPPAGAAAHPLAVSPSRVLIATTNMTDMLIAPSGFCEEFIDVIAPGLKRLAAAGVELELRPHPNEDPARYRRLLDAYELDVRVVPGGLFSDAAAGMDILISSTSSVAFEAAGLGLPVLLWLSGAPQWVRREHLVTLWTENAPGTFEGAEDFRSLADGLLERPAQTLDIAYALGRRLGRFAEPFRPDRFAEGLQALTA
jgi:hypothetical protein